MYRHYKKWLKVNAKLVMSYAWLATQNRQLANKKIAPKLVCYF